MNIEFNNREKEPAMSDVPQEPAVSEKEEWLEGRIPSEIEDEELERLIPPDGFWEAFE